MSTDNFFEESRTPEVEEVERRLKFLFPKLDIEWIHSGGGIFGFSIQLPEGELFWGAVDGTWGSLYKAIKLEGGSLG